MNWKEIADSHWNDLLGLFCIMLAIPCYVFVNPEFGALIAGAGVGVLKGDRSMRKRDAG